MPIVSENEATVRRLRGAFDMSDLVERSFRSMIRETMFVRPPGARFEKDALARALRYLESHLVRTGNLAQHERAEIALTAVIDRFVRSRICDRLRLLPASQLFAPESAECDLLVISADGKRFGIRFVAGVRFAPTSPRLHPKAANAGAVDEVLTYDLHSGRVKRESASLSTLCA